MTDFKAKHPRHDATCNAIAPYIDMVGEQFHDLVNVDIRELMTAALIEGASPPDAMHSFYASAIQTAVGATIEAVCRADRYIAEAGNAPEEIRDLSRNFAEQVLPIAIHTLITSVIPQTLNNDKHTALFNEAFKRRMDGNVVDEVYDVALDSIRKSAH